MDFYTISLLVLAVIFIINVHITNIQARNEILQIDKKAISAYNLGVWISVLEAITLTLLVCNIIFHVSDFETSLMFWIPFVSMFLVLISVVLSTVAAMNYKNSAAYNRDPDPYNKFIREIVLNGLTVVSLMFCFVFRFIRLPDSHPTNPLPSSHCVCPTSNLDF